MLSDFKTFDGESIVLNQKKYWYYDNDKFIQILFEKHYDDFDLELIFSPDINIGFRYLDSLKDIFSTKRNCMIETAKSFKEEVDRYNRISKECLDKYNKIMSSVE